MNALAILTKNRSPKMPNPGSAREQKLTDFEVSGLFALFLPTPTAVIQKPHDAPVARASLLRFGALSSRKRCWYPACSGSKRALRGRHRLSISGKCSSRGFIVLRKAMRTRLRTGSITRRLQRAIWPSRANVAVERFGPATPLQATAHQV